MSGSQLHTTLHTNTSGKTVRITFPRPDHLNRKWFYRPRQSNHPPRQSQRINASSSQAFNRIVLATCVVEKAERLRSGSEWRQHDLSLLKVNFDPPEKSELTMLDVDHEWSSSKRRSILSPPPILRRYSLMSSDRSRGSGSGTRCNYSIRVKDRG